MKMECPRCDAVWSLASELRRGDELCPNCCELGRPAKRLWRPTGVKYSVGAESQELPPLLPEQANIRLVTEKYVEAVEAFDKTLDEKQRAYIRCTTREMLRELGKFAGFLEGIGLPLENIVGMTKHAEDAEKLSRLVGENKDRAVAMFELFWSLYDAEEM